MRFVFVVGVLLFPFLTSASRAGNPEIQELIRRLGSSNFKEREAAVKALKLRSDSMTALRDAVHSKDREIANRALEILDYFDRASLRDIGEAVAAGRAQQAIEMIGALPPGRFEAEAWSAARELAQKIDLLHQKQGGKGIGRISQWRNPPVIISEKRVNEQPKKYDRGNYMIRAQVVDIDYLRLKEPYKGNRFEQSDVFFLAAGSANLGMMAANKRVVFAGRSVSMTGEIDDALILSGGDISHFGDLHNCLVIARGNVKLEIGLMHNCRIITGQSLIGNKKHFRNCVISENDPNPLGFIRWSDPPKDKKPAPSK